jgi:hypothetical protein
MSYLTIEINEVDVIGKGWFSQPMATTYRLDEYDLESIGKLNRDNVENWLMKNSGDFQMVDDFQVDIKDFQSDFNSVDNYYEWLSMMYPE